MTIDEIIAEVRVVQRHRPSLVSLPVADALALCDEIERLRAENEQYRALAHLCALDVTFVSFQGHGFFVPFDTDGNRAIAFNVICNDTFAYACADAEGITLEKAPEILRLYRAGGWPAVARWVQEQRGGPSASPFIVPVAEAMKEDDALRAEIERWKRCEQDVADLYEYRSGGAEAEILRIELVRQKDAQIEQMGQEIGRVRAENEALQRALAAPRLEA